MQLAERLRADSLDIGEPRIVARTGWTTAELRDALHLESVGGRFDLVTLLVGVNDQYRGLGLARYRDSFPALLGDASRLAKPPGSLIVLSIPDWSVTPFAAGRDRDAIAREIDEFNGVNRWAAASAGARYLDVTSISRQALNNTHLLAADGLHPSAPMYGMWVDLLVPVVKGILDAEQRHRRPDGGG